MLPASHITACVEEAAPAEGAHTLLEDAKYANQAHSAAHHDGDVGEKSQCTALLNYHAVMQQFTDSPQEFCPPTYG